MGKIFTQADYNHEQARKNFQKYLSQLNLTRPDLHLLKKNGTPNMDAVARYLGYSDSRTVTKFLRDKDPKFQNWTFTEIADRTGIHEAYWRGLTDEQDGDKYEERLRAIEANEELDRLRAERHRNEVDRYTVFFDCLGYRYECSDDWDDDCLGTKRPHTLTRKGTSDSQHLSEKDLQKVIDEAAGFLDYALYKIRRE